MIPILQEFVQEHIMNMLQYHSGVCKCHAEENKLLKSEVESLNARHWQAQKIQKWKIRQKRKTHKTI
jgi:hypothetical protein